MGVLVAMDLCAAQRAALYRSRGRRRRTAGQASTPSQSFIGGAHGPSTAATNVSTWRKGTRDVTRPKAPTLPARSLTPACRLGRGLAGTWTAPVPSRRGQRPRAPGCRAWPLARPPATGSHGRWAGPIQCRPASGQDSAHPRRSAPSHYRSAPALQSHRQAPLPVAAPLDPPWPSTRCGKAPRRRCEPRPGSGAPDAKRREARRHNSERAPRHPAPATPARARPATRSRAPGPKQSTGGTARFASASARTPDAAPVRRTDTTRPKQTARASLMGLSDQPVHAWRTTTRQSTRFP